MKHNFHCKSEYLVMPAILPSSRLSAILRQDTVSARFLFDTANEEIDKCPCPCPKRKNYTAVLTENDAKP